MATASRILGDQVGSTAPAFLAILAIHVLAGLTAVITGAAAGLAAMRWAQDYYLFILGAVAFTAATIGYLHRRRHRPGDTGHIAGMGIAYTAMLTAFYVDNGPHLPLWDRLPTLAFWLLPSVIAAPSSGVPSSAPEADRPAPARRRARRSARPPGSMPPRHQDRIPPGPDRIIRP